MGILFLMIICSVSLAVVFLSVFVYNARKGQFEDDESPAVRILLDKEGVEDSSSTEEGNNNNNNNEYGNTEV